ncbi:MAG: hypothetical protein GYB65_18320, partial [Chloroflexi bacterium]|nr:hypothetical protein [Chloroflexota bacterium]
KDSSGNQLTWSDDEYNLDAAIVGFTLPADDWYSIEATGYGEGYYNLYLYLDASAQPAPQPAPQPSVNNGGPLMYDNPVWGYMNLGVVDVWTFYGSANDIVTIEMRDHSGGFLDTHLSLYDSNDNFLIDNDDFYGFDAAIVRFTLPYDDQFTIYATDTGSGVGDYLIGVYLVGTAGSGSGSSGSGSSGSGVIATPISYGMTLRGTIPASAPDIIKRYVFEGTAGDDISIYVVSTDGNLDATLAVLNNNMQQIEFNDDAAVGVYNPQLDLTLPYTGTYYLDVAAYNQASSGDFTINLQATASSAPPAPPSVDIGDVVGPAEGYDTTSPPPANAVELFYGDSIDGTVTVAGAYEMFYFEGDEDDLVTVSAESQTQGFTPLLVVADATLTPIIETSGQNAEVQLALPQDGTYTILVTTAEGSATGDYTLALDVDALQPIQGTIAYNTIVTGTLPDCDTVHYWELATRPSTDNYPLNVIARQQASPNLDLSIGLYEDGYLTTFNNDGEGMGLDPWIKNYEAFPADYVISVGCVGTTGGSYTLEVLPVLILN